MSHCKKMEVSIRVSKDTNDIKYISKFIQQSCNCAACNQTRKKMNKINTIYNQYYKPTNEQTGGSLLNHNSTVYLNNNISHLVESLYKTEMTHQLFLSPNHDFYLNRYYHLYGRNRDYISSR